VEPTADLRYRAIPSVPTEVFKRVDLCTFPPDQATATFLTSGTTIGTRGRHLLRRTDTYEASLAAHMDQFLLPRGGTPVIRVLAPPEAVDPHSSLSYMLQWAVDHRGAPSSAFHWTADGPDVDGFLASISDEPTLVLATARALQAVLESGAPGAALAPGSAVMETGGFKGATRSLPRVEFYRRIRRFFALPDHAVVSEYGMTELASQGYHASFRDRSLRGDPDEDQPLVFPPWCRVATVDPHTLEVLPDGTRGLLRFWDLANVDSILAVQTADVGVVTPAGLLLEGRAPGASPRGCSLAVDEILRGVS
jgi:acyl-CoA synthetase (AMP-forming)/AMP-acid ligase II